jgi:hypothetical protein
MSQSCEFNEGCAEEQAGRDSVPLVPHDVLSGDDEAMEVFEGEYDQDGAIVMRAAEGYFDDFLMEEEEDEEETANVDWDELNFITLSDDECDEYDGDEDTNAEASPERDELESLSTSRCFREIASGNVELGKRRAEAVVRFLDQEDLVLGTVTSKSSSGKVLQINTSDVIGQLFGRVRAKPFKKCLLVRL